MRARKFWGGGAAHRNDRRSLSAKTWDMAVMYQYMWAARDMLSMEHILFIATDGLRMSNEETLQTVVYAPGRRMCCWFPVQAIWGYGATQERGITCFSIYAIARGPPFLRHPPGTCGHRELSGGACVGCRMQSHDRVDWVEAPARVGKYASLIDPTPGFSLKYVPPRSSNRCAAWIPGALVAQRPHLCVARRSLVPCVTEARLVTHCSVVAGASPCMVPATGIGLLISHCGGLRGRSLVAPQDTRNIQSLCGGGAFFMRRTFLLYGVFSLRLFRETLRS